MNTKARKPLEQWQIDDAARLRALFEQRSELSQAAFGAEYEIGSQGVVWQYLTGHIPLNLPAVVKFARGLGTSVAEISPTLGKLLGDQKSGLATALGQIIMDLPEDDPKLAIDFVQYRLERNQKLMAKEKFAHYMKMITSIKQDMTQKTDGGHDEKKSDATRMTDKRSK
jgi:hypothetical protein